MKNYWGIKPINIKSKGFHLNIDSDSDGVIDYKDCKPFDKKKQHLSRAKKEDLRSIDFHYNEEYPIMTTRKGKGVTLHPYPAYRFEQGAEQEAPYTSAVIRSIAKHYPGVIGEIKRANPEKVIVYKKSARDFDLPRYEQDTIITGDMSIKDKYGKKVSPIIWVAPSPYIEPRTKKDVEEYAKILLHETKHVQETKEGIDYESAILSKKEYEEHEGEKVAEAWAQEKFKEFSKKGKVPSGKTITKILGLEEEDRL